MGRFANSWLVRRPGCLRPRPCQSSTPTSTETLIAAIPFSPALVVGGGKTEHQRARGGDEALCPPQPLEVQVGQRNIAAKVDSHLHLRRDSLGLGERGSAIKGGARPKARATLWPNIIAGMREQPPNPKPIPSDDLSGIVLSDWKTDPDNLELIHAGILLRIKEPTAAALQTAFNPMAGVPLRIAMLGLLGQSGNREIIAPAKQLLLSKEAEPLRQQALLLLGKFDDSDITTTLLTLYKTSPSDSLKVQIRNLLLSRKSSAKVWLDEVDRGSSRQTKLP